MHTLLHIHTHPNIHPPSLTLTPSSFFPRTLTLRSLSYSHAPTTAYTEDTGYLWGANANANQGSGSGSVTAPSHPLHDKQMAEQKAAVDAAAMAMAVVEEEEGQREGSERERERRAGSDGWHVANAGPGERARGEGVGWEGRG